MNASQQYCTFYLDDLLFGVEVEKVQEVIRYHEITRVPCAPLEVRGLINLRGEIVTAIDLRKRLDLGQRASESLPMNVVVKIGDDVVSLLVDEIGEVITVATEGFEPPPDTLQGVPRELIRGVYKLEEQLLLVLDAEATSTIQTERA